MKYQAKLCISVFLWVFYTQSLAQAITPQTIIEQYFDAIGGKQNWAQLHHLKIIRTHRFSDTTLFVNTIYLVPQIGLRHESILENGSNHFVYAVHKNKGWNLNAPSAVGGKITTYSIDPEECQFLLKQSQLHYGLENYQSADYMLEFTGEVFADNAFFYQVKMTSKLDKSKVVYLFDKQTHLLAQMWGDVSVLGMRQPYKSKVYLSDYRKVQYWLFPFKISVAAKEIMFGQARFFEVEKVIPNADFQESIFDK